MAGSRAGGPDRPDPRRAFGAAGEDAAARWYTERGWTVLARNWRGGRHGEIDLIVARDRTLVFSEVKTRRSRAYGHPAEAVTPDKQARIRRLAAMWMAETGQGRGRRVRFDVVAILDGEIDVIESAF